MNYRGRPAVIIFDVNERLLDMDPVKVAVNKALDSKRAFTIWFGLLLQYTLVDTVTGNYHDFGTIAGATLEMAAKNLDTTIKEKEIASITEIMKDLPPHKDVKEGLALLKNNGIRLATLTNSANATLLHQLESAGLRQYFSDILSVEEFKLYKPHVDVYTKTLSKLSVQAGEALMAAAHGWDIAGAQLAGMQAALIERKGQAIYPLAPKPRYIAKDLVDLAQQVISAE